jgi:hypothetical protein
VATAVTIRSSIEGSAICDTRAGGSVAPKRYQGIHHLLHGVARKVAGKPRHAPRGDGGHGLDEVRLAPASRDQVAQEATDAHRHHAG